MVHYVLGTLSLLVHGAELDSSFYRVFLGMVRHGLVVLFLLLAWSHGQVEVAFGGQV